MKVLYYSSTAYLDIAIEVVNLLKNYVDLHVLIEITPGLKIKTILEVNKLPKYKSIVGVQDLMEEEDYKYFEPYFKGCASANFIVHSHQSGTSLSTFTTSYETWKYIKGINPDIIHLEAMSLRSLGLVPFLFSKTKICITIHDVVPHSSKKDWKVSVPRLLYLKMPYRKTYFYYSEFSKKQYERLHKNDKNPKFALHLYPYTFFPKFAKKQILHKKHILFFGQISRYKGIETLIEAMPSVLEKYPNESLIIAGRSHKQIILNPEILEKFKSQITVLDRHIPNEELVNLIQEAKFVVCPYLDATQSGVVMTSYALNVPVIATNIGAFSEYIEQNVNGLLVPPNDPPKLADAIKLALQNNFYETMAENVAIKNDVWMNNKDIMLKAYSS